MNKNNYEKFKSSTKCWIFKKPYRKGDVKVTDHSHITEKYRGSAHKKCNINLSLTKKSLLCFVICKIMVHILFFKKVEHFISK